MNISRVRRSEEGEYDPADYIPTTDKDIKEMYAKVVAYVNSVKNPYLSKLLKMFFVEDKEFVKEFCKHSAAKVYITALWRTSRTYFECDKYVRIFCGRLPTHSP